MQRGELISWRKTMLSRTFQNMRYITDARSASTYTAVNLECRFIVVTMIHDGVV
jgi:hypothetical protein